MARLSCAQCQRPAGFCYCEHLPQIANRWPVLILQHREEASHPLNTARIAVLGLSTKRLQLAGDAPDELAWRQGLGLAGSTRADRQAQTAQANGSATAAEQASSSVNAATWRDGLPAGTAPAGPLLIYPGPGSQAFDPAQVPLGTPLLFLDASWRKSRRLLLGSPWLRSLPCRHLLPQAAPRYRIRREPAAHCRSTLEAIVQTLCLLGDHEAEQLLTVMDWMIERQQACMPRADSDAEPKDRLTTAP